MYSQALDVIRFKKYVDKKDIYEASLKFLMRILPRLIIHLSNLVKNKISQVIKTVPFYDTLHMWR